MHPINVTNKPSNPISPTPSCAGLSRASTSSTPQEDIPSLLQSDETLAAAEQWAQGTAHYRFAVAPQVLFIHRRFARLSSFRFHRDFRPQQHRAAEPSINVAVAETLF